MTRFARAPLLHFVVLGALLFAFERFTADGRALGFVREPIIVPAAEVERLRAEWSAETGRNPDRFELEAAIRQRADEEILFREALRLGLDRSDPVVHARLVQNLRFIHGEPQADDAAMFAEGLALGMNRTDVVVRRRLVDAMEARFAERARVSEADARAYAGAHPERFGALVRVSFDQVFVSADRHGAALADAAGALGRELATTGAAQGAGLGDPFLYGTHFTAQSATDIARAFGSEVADAALKAPVGTWIGPVHSPYGLHFLRVASKARALEDPAAAQREAYYTLLDERGREAARDQLAALRRGYPLEIEWPKLALGAP